MNRLSAHIGYPYTELPFIDRISAAANNGFTAIEHNEPFDVPAGEMRRRLNDLGLSFSQLSSGMGDAGKGEKGLAALCGRETEFRDDFLRALEYAQVIGCPLINPLAGTPHGGMLDASETYSANIGWAIEACIGSDVAVLVEPITVPGYYLSSLKDAVSLQERFGRRFKLLFDTFHAGNMQVDPVVWIDTHAERIGHVHIADHPGRHEPGTGTVNFPGVIEVLDRHGYRGALGFEYVPTGSTLESIAFLKTWKCPAQPAAPSQIHPGASS